MVGSCVVFGYVPLVLCMCDEQCSLWLHCFVNQYQIAICLGKLSEASFLKHDAFLLFLQKLKWALHAELYTDVIVIRLHCCCARFIKLALRCLCGFICICLEPYRCTNMLPTSVSTVLTC